MPLPMTRKSWVMFIMRFEIRRLGHRGWNRICILELEVFVMGDHKVSHYPSRFRSCQVFAGLNRLKYKGN
jgi:hypothetical protein